MREFFRPQRNSMVEFVELSKEVIAQTKLQRKNKSIRPYDIFECDIDSKEKDKIVIGISLGIMDGIYRKENK